MQQDDRRPLAGLDVMLLDAVGLDGVMRQGVRHGGSSVEHMRQRLAPACDA